MDIRLTVDDKRYLLAVARETIASELEKREAHFPRPSSDSSQSGGAFVTLHERGALRGCIGRMESDEPLFETIKSMAFAAAFDDPRFDSLTLPELERIDIEISVLSPMRRVSSPEEVVVGIHGVLIEGFGRSGVLLPQVATENGWERKEFLDYVCRKAGLPEGTWKSKSVSLFTFEGLVFGENEFRTQRPSA